MGYRARISPEVDPVASTSLLSSLFGDGSDGSIVYDVTDSRWEDQGGAPIDAGHFLVASGRVSVSGTTMTVLLPLRLRDLTIPAGATVVVGEHSATRLHCPHLLIRGALTVAGTLRAQHREIVGPAPGGRKTTAGAGNSTSASPAYAYVPMGGGGGAGGGDGTNNGGNGGTMSASGVFLWPIGRDAITAVSGTTGAGTSAGAVMQGTYLFGYWNAPRLLGRNGLGGGGGALKTTETGAYGGAGGSRGAAGGLLDIRAWRVRILAGGIIHADGANGGNGEDGSSVSAGNRAGGGGGGGGGAGGIVTIGYGPGGYEKDVDGFVRANGGLGGTGGAGRRDNQQPEPNSNGGNGAAGQGGFVVIEKLL